NKLVAALELESGSIQVPFPKPHDFWEERPMRHSTCLFASVFLALLVLLVPEKSWAGPVGYDIEGIASYHEGGSGIGGTAMGDTSFIDLSNMGASTFMGTISL